MIETKRDGGVLSGDAIAWFIDAFTDGIVRDYQMSAMAMAIYFNGLDDDELAAWTAAMLSSGEILDFSDLPNPKVDKHSTGGVGDKISIPLAPLVAACGVVVPMISGRGLGHTGGTLDKLESIPGFITGLNPHRFRAIVQEHGMVMAGQSETMAPADRMLYALRDTTGTVPSIPLITSSIMSKKLAEGIDGLLLDVKTGSGAQTKTIDRSRELAEKMVRVGESYGVRTIALITAMDQPLGFEVGNANEIKESLDVLRGDGPADVTELTLGFGEVMLEMAGLGGGRQLLEDQIESGAALKKLKEITAAHGGDVSVLEDPTILPRASHEALIKAPRSGYVTRCDAYTVGLATTRLGAGRDRKEDRVDHGVGVSLRAKVGDQVNAGGPLAIVSYSDANRWEAERDYLASAWEIGDAPPPPAPLILERIEV